MLIEGMIQLANGLMKISANARTINQITLMQLLTFSLFGFF